MAQQLFANNAFSSLASTITNVATSITLATGHGSRFPTPSGGDHFLATLVGVDSNGNENSWEIVKVTTRSADVLTVVRGQEGSTALPWVAGSRIELRATSGTFAGLLQLAGGIVTGATTFSSGAYTALKVGVTGLVSVGGEAGSAEAKLTVTDAGNVGLEFSPTAIAGANRILSYNRASMAFAPMTLMALSHKFNVGGTDMVTVDSTGMSYTGTLTGGTGVVNIGSGQLYKDASGNVGFGTASPASKLHIVGDVGVAKRSVFVKPTNEPAAIDSVRTFAIERSGNDSALALGYSTTRDAFVISSTYGSTGAYKPLVLATSDQDRVTIDTAGNFGLGVTPSAWNSTYRAIDIAGGSISGRTSTSNQVDIASNAYRDAPGNWVYKFAGPAVHFTADGSSGGYQWFTAPSGTAGNPISFTQAMTLGQYGDLTLWTPINTSTTQYITGGWAGTGYGARVGFRSNAFSHAGAEILFERAVGIGGWTESGRFDLSGNLKLNGSSGAWASAGSDGLQLSGVAYGSVSTISTYLDDSAIQIGAGVSQKTGIIIYGQTTATGSAVVFQTGGLQRARIDTGGNLLVGVTSGSNHIISKNVGNSAGTTAIFEVQNAGSDTVAQFMSASSFSTASSAGTGMRIGRSTSTGRSINAGGTINQSGADYAEYERNNGLSITKGSIVGFKADGSLTLTFEEAIRFGVKSTAPGLVGGDTWAEGIGARPEKPTFTSPAYTGPAAPGEEPTAPADDADEATIEAYAQAHAEWNEAFAVHDAAMAEHAGAVAAAQAEFEAVEIAAYTAELAAFEARLEAARQMVDRIAYSGKVPCNVTGATPGDYIVATAAADGSITGVSVADPDFAQYRKAVGRVNRLLPDGRCEVAVIIH